LDLEERGVNIFNSQQESNIKDDIDVALFSAGGSISKEYAPKFKAKGAIVIDNSSAWRMEKDIPLVVPEANPEALDGHNGIIANPNCSTIQVMPVLKVLADKYGLKRVVYSTYQAVAGSGQKGINDLEANLKGEPSTNYPHQIAFNLLPHIDSFLDNGYTKEEIAALPPKEEGQEGNLSESAIGFHITGAFDKIYPIKKCWLMDDLHNEIRNEISRYAKENSMSFYDIRAQHGLLRDLMMRNSNTGEFMLLVQFHYDKEGDEQKAMQLLQHIF